MLWKKCPSTTSIQAMTFTSSTHFSLVRTAVCSLITYGSTKLDNPTNLGSILISTTTELFERIADKTLTVRRITIAANRVVKDEGFFQVDLFTDTTKLEKEKKLQNAMLGLKKKFGKNAVLKGTNYLDGATMRERNKTIGGHKAE